jgi:WD40 repeat protein
MGVFFKRTPEHPHSLTTLQAHQACVCQALFSPHQPDLVATRSANGTIRFFDLRSPAFASTSSALHHHYPLPYSRYRVLSVSIEENRHIAYTQIGPRARRAYKGDSDGMTDWLFARREVDLR